MKRVIQEDSSGCGIACIAMLADTKYSIVKEVAIDILNLDEYYGLYTSASNLKKLGKSFRLEIGGYRRKFKSIKELPDLAILAINYRESLKIWHWVVFCRDSDNEFILDPKASIKSEYRTDFSRITTKARWFISVAHK